MDPNSVTITATSLPNIAAAISTTQGLINNPVLMLAGTLALGAHFKAAVAKIESWIVGIGTWIKTPKAQAEIKDVTQLAADFQQGLADSGHPEPAQASATINGLLAQVPAITKALPLILLFLGLSSMAHAVSLSLGPISISPTAGPCVVTVIPAVEMSFYRMGAGVIFTNENDGVVGIQALLNWGQYNVGIEGAFDKDITDNVNYGAAGVVVGLQPYGQIAALWRDKGAILGYSVPLTAIGISAQ